MKTSLRSFLPALLFNFFFVPAQAMNPTHSEPTELQVSGWLEKKTYAFEENKGQIIDTDGNTPTNIFFRTSIPGTNIYISDKGLIYSFYSTEGRRATRKMKVSRLEMELIGARIGGENITAALPTVGVNNYYLGQCPKGITNVRSFRRITLTDIYPGIDWIIYYSEEKGLKYDFIIHPGGDPSRIRMKYVGNGDVMKLNDHTLKLVNPLGEIAESGLFVFEEGSNEEIGSKFKIEKNTVTFELGPYNKTKNLIIDPQLVWGTYYGGNNHDGFWGITIDNAGNVIVTGETETANLPVLNPVPPRPCSHRSCG